MSEQRKFALPSYVNIPLFLYQDNSLERSSLILASFIYSLHTAGKSIKVSNQYLSQLLNIHPRKVQENLESLEYKKYIVREGSTSNRIIRWIFVPESQIIIVEDLPTHADNGVALTPTTALDSRRQRHPYIKDNNKEDTKRSCANSSNCTNFSFEDFWKIYPSKKAVKKCREIWRRRNLDGMAEEIIIKLRNQIENDDHFLQGFIPNPSTYLNGDRWDDEITESKASIREKEILQKKLDNEIRIAQQEIITQKNAEYERNKFRQMNQDGKIFRGIVSEVAKESLNSIKQSMGIK